jgi:hypothetical protein
VPVDGNTCADVVIPRDASSSADQPTFNSYPYKESVEYEVKKRISAESLKPLDWEPACTVSGEFCPSSAVKSF